MVLEFDQTCIMRKRIAATQHAARRDVKEKVWAAHSVTSVFIEVTKVGMFDAFCSAHKFVAVVCSTELDLVLIDQTGFGDAQEVGLVTEHVAVRNDQSMPVINAPSE